MTKAVYPGSFDPITKGHHDVIKRAAEMFDELYVAVLSNSAKTPLFTTDERIAMIKMVTKDIPNVKVASFDGLTVDFVRSKGCNVIVRGLRAVSDYEYELQIAQTNRVIAPDIDTVFLCTAIKYSYLSSSIVKEIASYGRDLSKFLDPEIERIVKEKFNYGGNDK